MIFLTKSLFLITVFFLTSTLANGPLPLPLHRRANSKKALLPGKRGLPYLSPPVSIQNFNDPSSQVTWAYDWSSKGINEPTFPANLEYVPILWSAKQATNWTVNVEKAIARGTKNILAFNEPDLSSQANMSPTEAAAAYKQYIQPFAGRVNLGAPACTESPSGTAWLMDFLSKCTGCTIDFIPVHIYSTTSAIGHFQRHIQEIHNLTGKPIWITEFHASGSSSKQKAFLKTFMTWLDQQDYVLRYAWYKCSPTYTSGTLCEKNGKVSTLGKLYEDFPN